MPHEPTAPPGTSIFARIDRFHCECPSCGSLVVAAIDLRRSRERDILAKRANKQRRTQTSREHARQNRTHPYNPFLQTLTCPSCERVYIVGLLLWTPRRGSWKVRPPADTLPNRRQIAQLRAYAESKWPWQLKRFGDPVNVVVEGECCCPAPDGRDPACPIHGNIAT